MRIQSNDIVLLDTTDTKKIDLHITSNHPTVQIYNQNASQNQLTPNWSTDPLELTPIIYIDAEEMTDYSKAKFTWSMIKGSETNGEWRSDSRILIISNNEDLDNSPTVRYRCKVEYNNKSFFNEITFVRVDTGKNGLNGNSAPVVKAQYSEDGISIWTDTLDESKHKYIRLSYDNGATWPSVFKIAGEDGKSVQVKGVAYSKTTPVSGQSIVLYSDESTNTQITNATEGDSYLVEGYLCVYNGNQFICTGQIQGPQGKQGDSYYLFIRYASDANGTSISSSPSGKTYIGFYRSSINQVPTDSSAATWNWAKFAGEDAKIVTLTGSAQAFKVDKSNVVSPTTIKVTAQIENTTIPNSGWSYSTDGGQTFTSTVPTGVVRNGNVVTLTGASISSNSISVKATDGTHSDVFTVYKVSDGADGAPGEEGAPAYTAFLTNESIAFVSNSSGQVSSTTVYSNVVVYKGTEKVAPTIGTISGLPTGMSITSSTISGSNELQLAIAITDKATLGSTNSTYGSINIPITTPIGVNLKLNWSKINSGAKGDTGIGIKSVTVTYGTSTSATTQPTSWQSTIPTIAEGSYLWTRTITDYTDDAIADTVTYTYAKQGKTGETGAPGSSVTVSKIEYQSGTSATTTPTGTWSSSVVSVAEGSYLWTKTTFSDGKIAYGVAKQGEKGTPASLVNITPSAMYFKSTTGKDGTFTPEYIYLYPRFQNVVYSNWQYSIDGGATWVSASGANGVSIGTYNSITNTLRLGRTSTLYTDSVTSISFRCNSATSGVYDTVSVAKIYDVVDLQIGGRNMYLDTKNYGGDAPNKSIWNYGTSGVLDGTYLGLNVVKITGQWGRRWQSIPLTKFVVGSTYTMSAWIKNPGGDDDGYRTRVSYFRDTSASAGVTYTILSSNFTPYTYVPYEWTRISVTFRVDTITDSTQYCTFRFEPYTDDSANHLPHMCICGLKLEFGNKATDWSPAPEDVDNAIAIIETRVTSAEQKITNDAIVSTVRQSTGYKDDLGKKVGTTEIISKINQTAESITISANKIGLLGATNIPDLTADKIKGGTLTLGGSSATTQNGQMIVKNASNADILKLNKDGIVVKSGHLAIAEDFTHEAYDWTTGTWITTDNTSQLDLGDNFIRMGVYSGSNYDNYMHLQNKKLSFQGDVRGIGSWGSSIGHNEYGDFVIEDNVRGDIFIKGQDDATLARLNNNGLYVNGPIYGGIAKGNAKQLSNVFVEHFPGSHNGYIGVRLGESSKYDNSMITIKGHVTAYQDSTSFEASCYYYYEYGSFYGAVATATNPDVLKEVYFAEDPSTGYIYLLLGAVDSTWNYPTISIETISIGYNGYDASEWNREWFSSIYSNLSSFTRVTPCVRGGMSKILWSGGVAAGTTITLDENFRNFKFLTCVIGSESSPYGIVLGSFLDPSVTELHFFASTIITGTIVGKDFYVAKFNVINNNKISLTVCASATNSQAYVRKIVGWR